MDTSTCIDSLIDDDNVPILRRLLKFRERVSEDSFPDDSLLRLWKRVCSGQSAVDPQDVISAGLHYLKVPGTLEATEYFLCSPERTLEPTHAVMRTLYRRDDRKYLAARLADMNRRRDVLEYALNHMKYLCNAGAGPYELVHIAFKEWPDILDNDELLRNIAAAGSDNTAYFIRRLCFAKDEFEIYALIQRFLNACPPTGRFRYECSTLVDVAVKHLAFQRGIKVERPSNSECPHTKKRRSEDNHLRLAEESFRILSNSNSNPIEFDASQIEIEHPNWYRSRFIQECLVRVGLGDDRLYAVDSPIVAKWIVDYGDPHTAFERFKKARGDSFKLEEVHSSILEYIGNTNKII
jgi:hypothetical protein